MANWSLILNVLLLMGVIVAIGFLMKARRQNLNMNQSRPFIGSTEQIVPFNDDIIAVRKVNRDLPPEIEPVSVQPNIHDHSSSIPGRHQVHDQETLKEASKTVIPSLIMLFIVAKENRQFAGYELLQTVLASGLRFGDGHLFHRHQNANGQGPILCSLAAATTSGVFDLQNIGAFSVRGLCLFMHTAKNSSIDAERFTLMLETANQLCEGLDANLLDEQRRPFTEASMNHYKQILSLDHLVDEREAI